MKKENLCVLLVDDDDTGNYISKKVMLKSFPDAHVHFALNGQEALDFVDSNCTGEYIEAPCPDLILLDINMPVMDGFEFLEAFTKNQERYKNNIEIVILSSSENAVDKQLANSYNIKGYLTKPLTQEKVQGILNR